MNIYIIELIPGQITILTEKQLTKLDEDLKEIGGITWDDIIFCAKVNEIVIFNSTFKFPESG